MHIRSITLASILFALLIAIPVQSSGLDSSPETTTPPKNSLVVAKTRESSSGQVGTVTEFDLSLHPMAKNDNARQFREAIGGGDFKAAKKIFEKKILGLKGYCGLWFVQRGRDKVASEIIRIDDPIIKPWILQMVFIYASPEYIDDVLKKVEPSDGLLSWVANCEDLADHLDKFTLFLKKITDESHQKCAVGFGVCALFDSGKIKSFFPLLHELRSDKFSDSTLADAAVVQAFYSGCIYSKGKEFAACYSDYYALSSKDYANGLFNSYSNKQSNSGLFEFLLKKARREDLEMAMKYFCDGESAEYQKAVKSALPSASLLTRMTPKRRETIKEVLEAGIPLVIIMMIWDYDT